MKKTLLSLLVMCMCVTSSLNAKILVLDYCNGSANGGCAQPEGVTIPQGTYPYAWSATTDNHLMFFINTGSLQDYSSLHFTLSNLNTGDGGNIEVFFSDQYLQYKKVVNNYYQNGEKEITLKADVGEHLGNWTCVSFSGKGFENGSVYISNIYLDSGDIDENYPSNVSADYTTFSKAKLSGNSWTFNTPVDISAYRYMVVTTIQSCGKNGGGMYLVDSTGKKYGNAWWPKMDFEYNATDAGTRGAMWLDRWNNQHCAAINLKYLKEKGLDVKEITEFTVPNGENISAVYLTNYIQGQAIANKGQWGYCNGDYVRDYSLLSEGKFGTICLYYSAAVAGARLYEVESFDAKYQSLTLKETTDGIVDKYNPYIYYACDFVGLNGSIDNGNDVAGSSSNVNFYRIEEEDCSMGGNNTADDRGNGLVGYRDGGFNSDWIQGKHIISNNKLYKLDSKVDMGKYRCFFDVDKCTNVTNGSTDSNAKVVLKAADDDATAIKDISKSLNSGKIYDMNGREVKSLEKGGMYIMDGLKIRVK